MRKKRCVALLLAVVLLLSLAGCARGDGDGEQLSVTPSGETEPMKPTTPDATKPSEPTTPTKPAKPTEPSNPTAPTEPEPSKPVVSDDPTEPPAPTQPAHKHSYSATRTVAPTCTSGGYTVYACACGDSYNADATSALGHSFGDWTVTRKATYASEGEEARSCSRCGATETRGIPKLPMPQLDYAAAAAYGNSYAANKYGWIVDTSLNADNAGFYPPSPMPLDYVYANGGQDFLLEEMRQAVRATYSALVDYEENKDFTALVNCYAWEADGCIWTVVYYG